MHEFEDKDIFSSIIKAVKLRDKYVVGGPSMHPLQEEKTCPSNFSTTALGELLHEPVHVPSAPESAPMSDAASEEFVAPLVPEPVEPAETKPKTLPYRFQFVDGVMHVFDVFGEDSNVFPIPSIDEFYEDMDYMCDLRTSGPVQSFCFNRLQLLETKFELHGMVHTTTERNEMKANFTAISTMSARSTRTFTTRPR